MSNLRASETDEERRNRRVSNSQRMSILRASETEEERRNRRASNSQRMSTLRTLETIDHRQLRQLNNGMRMSNRRNKIWRQKENSAFAYDSNISYECDSLIEIGRMVIECSFCKALKWKGESSSMCCNNGKIQIPLLQTPPEPLLTLLSTDSPDAINFQTNIRRYNSCFQMTSFGSGREIRELGFMPTFKVQGQVYHRIGSLQPQPNEEPKFLQVYFVADKEQQVEQRCRNVNNIKPGIVCKELFQQFVVDMYAKIETERLRFIRLNQKKLRVEDYIHLRDAITNDDNIKQIGKPTILPSTFTGSPRYMHERTQDAMTYVRNYGSLHLFITFTCNPQWREITEELILRQKSHDRHDIICRVFYLKLKSLLNLINKGKIFGEIRCFIYTVEWQKRGLPHAHILLWFQEKLYVHMIDDLITAELPNPETDPILYNVVKTQMIHGPCGSINPLSPCMKDGKCTKRYPRDFLKETQTGHDGYPLYRRRKPEDGGQVTIKKVRGSEVVIDNRWIVPFCPLLSRALNAHINVEYCSSIKSIKYVCKYINKGSDMAIFNLKNNDIQHDEIQTYEIGRYLSSNEAVWRILGFPIHERHPTVVHLSVHLDNGPTSFSDLKTFNGIVCETFKQACELRGLLEDDSHWKSTLDEAATTHSGRMLRDLFAVILHTCCVSNPVQLWNLHRENMSEDILHKTRITVNNMDLDYNDEIFNSALLALEDKIKALGGTDLKVFGLPEVHRDINNSLNYEIIRETCYNIHQLTSYIETNEPNLTDDQRLAFEKITSAVFTETGGIYFLDAPGGTGDISTEQFAQNLLHLGNGTMTIDSEGLITLTNIGNIVATIEDLQDRVFPNIESFDLRGLLDDDYIGNRLRGSSLQRIQAHVTSSIAVILHT
ncbi:hypothetical protein HNY73_008646 [Argiope bruennichi]|uniref:Helitron helicase-like domain-containing protein n=1 Tax=Argiope bruennichi TaxID=94029 RepID=A0A8T0F780_ARGBR|nr:hypothetical protein HNY73_008646 [Argiope bruennichi]